MVKFSLAVLALPFLFCEVVWVQLTGLPGPLTVAYLLRRRNAD